MATTVCVSILCQNTANVTVANIQDLRDYVATAMPSAKVTWAPDNIFVFPWNKDAENAAVAAYLSSGDGLSMGDGFPAVDHVTLPEFSASVDEFFSGSQTRYGKVPTAATAWHYPASYLAYLRTKWVTTATATVWSQTGVDRFQGEGSRLFPYYPSTTNAFVPARTGKWIDVVSCNSLSPDTLGCRALTGDSRWTLHPADPDTTSSATQKHVLDQALASPGYPLFVTIEVDWLYSNPNLIARFKEWIDYAATKDVELITLDEYGRRFREANADNSASFGMSFQGSGLSFGNSSSPSSTVQKWYEDSECSVCLQKVGTWPWTVEACIRYVDGVPESYGKFYFEGHFYDDFSYRVGKSYKFDQFGKYHERTRYAFVERAKKYHGIQ